MFKWLIDLFTEPLTRHSSPFVIDNTLTYPRVDEAIELDFAGLALDQALAIMDCVAASGRVEWANAGEGDDTTWEEARRLIQRDGFRDFARVRCLDVPICGVVVGVLLIMAGDDENGRHFVELSFNASRFDEQRWGSLVATLHAYAIDIQKRFNVPEIYAGIPAEDPKYRLFTGFNFGPVRFDESGVHWPVRESRR